MTDDPNAPRRKKSRRKMRRITVPGDDVPRTPSVEEDIELGADDGVDDDLGDEEEFAEDGATDTQDEGPFDDEPTDPSVFDDEHPSGRRSVGARSSFVPPEGGSFRNDSVVVTRSRIISDRPGPHMLSTPPMMGDDDDSDDPVLEQVVASDSGDGDDEEARPTLHAEPPSAPVRTRTPPPPPAASIMIAADYAQELDELLLRRQADEALPHSLRPSAPAKPTSVRPARTSARPSAPPPRDSSQAPAAPAKPEGVRLPPPSQAFPEHSTGPRASAVPSVPTDARSPQARSKGDASNKPSPPSPPSPPRKILTPVPPAPNKPPPPPKEQPGAKRPPPWWKTFFSDDYLRSVIPPTPAQVKRQCDFLESVLNLPRGATILDVGCGTGLQAIELTERGYLVVGLDLSLPMITRAAEEAQYRNLRINFLHTDIREIQFDGAFDAVVCLGTTFGFFDDDSNRNVLGRLRDALKPGGRLLLDVANRDHVLRSQPNLVWFQGDGCVCMEESEFNYFTSRLHVKRTMMHEDGRQSDAEYSIRLYSLHEIGHLLNPLGFRVIEVSGQHATRGVFFGGDSAQIIALAERRAPKGDAEVKNDAPKAEPVKDPARSDTRPIPKPSLRPAPAPPTAAAADAPKRDSSDDLTELVEEDGAASQTSSNAFDEEEETDPNVRVPADGPDNT